jgi:hypothetical protein
VYCWGSAASSAHGYQSAVDFRYESPAAAFGRLPNGGAVDLGDFDAEPGIDRAKRIFVLRHDVCALMESDDLRCWGNNAGGQLGLGFAADEHQIGNIGDDETPGEAYSTLGSALLNLELPGSGRPRLAGGSPRHRTRSCDQAPPSLERHQGTEYLELVVAPLVLIEHSENATFAQKLDR